MKESCLEKPAGFHPKTKNDPLFTLQTPRMHPCWRDTDLSHNKDILPGGDGEVCALRCVYARVWETKGKKCLSQSYDLSLCLYLFLSLSDSQSCWRWNISLLWLLLQVNKTVKKVNQIFQIFSVQGHLWADKSSLCSKGLPWPRHISNFNLLKENKWPCFLCSETLIVSRITDDSHSTKLTFHLSVCLSCSALHPFHGNWSK